MISKLMRDRRGSPSLEALFVLPVILMLFFMIVETGFIMYDWTTVNYAAASAAVSAAKEGKFSGEVRSDAAGYIHDWTTGGRALAYDYTATEPYEDAGTVVIWGTGSEQNVERNNPIVVGVVYPVKFKILLADNIWKWVVKEEVITLKARAVALSEVHFEP